MKRIDKTSLRIIIVILTVMLILTKVSSLSIAIVEDGSIAMIQKKWWGIIRNDYELQQRNTQWYIRELSNNGVSPWGEFYVNDTEYTWSIPE
ncbi:hypothetical protein [Paenibacillus sp. PL91]|uniref:hypothetical protein n=1 Tax=Paenibacillus sp. PL91 TaxID=2729538 RepID=UPI00145F4F5D|nr:hypothetical protein [Paenibacillus sp. PL91]MBC9199803.1 hypothetical protein [Paenibacillus sp. PL91]